MPDRLTVYVADDHPVYMEGLVRAIRERPEFEFVGSASDGRQALDEIRALAPSVALIDVRMPKLDGMAVLNAVTRDKLSTRIVFLSASHEPEEVYDAVAAGVAGYLSKDSSRAEICDAVAAVGRGADIMGAEVQGALSAEIRLRGHSRATVLSPRESEILELTAEGLSAREIGERLHLSQATVKTHLQSLYEKLEVSDKAAAVAKAMREGLLE